MPCLTYVRRVNSLFAVMSPGLPLPSALPYSTAARQNISSSFVTPLKNASLSQAARKASNVSACMTSPGFCTKSRYLQHCLNVASSCMLLSACTAPVVAPLAAPCWLCVKPAATHQERKAGKSICLLNTQPGVALRFTYVMNTELKEA